jgi:hypothetical protein
VTTKARQPAHLFKNQREFDMDDTKSALQAMPRPEGTGYQAVDRVLVNEMRPHWLAGKSWTRAAWLVVDRAPGTGTKEAKVKRLVALAKLIYGEVSPERNINSVIQPSGDAGESGSVEPMQTNTATPAQPDIAALVARLAASEARGAALEARVAQVERLADENDRIVAILIKQQSLNEDMRDAVNRYAEAVERKLYRMGVPRTH